LLSLLQKPFASLETEVLSGGVQIGNVTTKLSHFSDLVMETGMADKILEETQMPY